MDRFSVLLEDLQRFVDLLRVSQEVPATPEWKDERASAVVELVQFAKATDRPDMYARFTRQLSRIMVDSKDWLGAGYALKLEADSHPWTLDGVVVGPVEDGTIRLPEQTPFARRESLYYHAIDHFGKSPSCQDSRSPGTDGTQPRQRRTSRLWRCARSSLPSTNHLHWTRTSCPNSHLIRRSCGIKLVKRLATPPSTSGLYVHRVTRIEEHR